MVLFDSLRLILRTLDTAAFHSLHGLTAFSDLPVPDRLNRGAQGEAGGTGEDAAIRINLSLIDPATARALLASVEVDRGPDDANPQVKPDPETR
jgi:hypothetical protein